MKILVEGIYGVKIRALHDAGWQINDNDKSECGVAGWRYQRRLCGVSMEKDLPSMGDALREFERLMGSQAISDTDQCECPIYTFHCLDSNPPFGVSGWEALKYLYKKWAPTPRETLEAWNNETEKS